MAKPKEEEEKLDIDMDKDYYAILGLDHMASVEEIQKQWKILVIKAHPDKCPDDPNAGEKFQELRKAYTILKDEKIKAAYDIVVRMKIAREKRVSQMNLSRKNMKEDLEAREKAFQLEQEQEERAKRNLEAALSRAREESIRLRQAFSTKTRQHQEEIQKIHEQSQQQQQLELTTLRIKWDPSKPPYSEDRIRKIFCLFGEIDLLLMGKKKKNRNISSCVLSFKTIESAKLASQQILGDPDHLLEISYSGSSSNTTLSPTNTISPTNTTKKLKIEDSVFNEDYENDILNQLLNGK